MKWEPPKRSLGHACFAVREYGRGGRLQAVDRRKEFDVRKAFEFRVDIEGGNCILLRRPVDDRAAEVMICTGRGNVRRELRNLMGKTAARKIVLYHIDVQSDSNPIERSNIVPVKKKVEKMNFHEWFRGILIENEERAKKHQDGARAKPWTDAEMVEIMAKEYPEVDTRRPWQSRNCYNKNSFMYRNEGRVPLEGANPKAGRPVSHKYGDTFGGLASKKKRKVRVRRKVCASKSKMVTA